MLEKNIVIFFVIIILNTTLCQSIQLREVDTFGGDFIGEISQIAVDTKSRIYIGDLINSQIHVFNSSDKYITSIGRKGKGPGEFQYIWGLQISKGDSLIVFDGQLNRVTVYAPGKFNESITTVKIGNSPDGEFPAVIGSLNKDLNSLWIDKNGNFIIAFAMGYSNINLNKSHYVNLYTLNRQGIFKEKKPFLRMKSKDWLVVTRGKGFMVSPMPFGRTPIVRESKDGALYYGYTGQPAIKTLDDQSRDIKTLNFQVNYVPISKLMWDKKIKSDNSITGEILDNSIVPLPKYLPAFEDFIVDDKKNVWVAINTEDPNNYTWLVYDHDNHLKGKFKLSKTIMIRVVNNNFGYAVKTGEYGLQSIVKYKIIYN